MGPCSCCSTPGKGVSAIPSITQLFLFISGITAFRLLPNPAEKGHLFFPYPACTEAADKELLPTHHQVSVYPKREFPVWTLFASMLSCSVAMFAILFHQYPDDTLAFMQSVGFAMRWRVGSAIAAL